MSFKKMVQPNSSPSVTGFGSTMHGGLKSLLFSMPYLQKQMSQEEGISVKQLDYYYIQQKGFYSAVISYTSESERIQARLKWKKIELFNEYNKIDFSPKVKE